MSTEKLERLLTVRELSSILSVSDKIIYRLISAKQIPYTKIGGKYLFQANVIEEWLQSNTNMVK
jgi:excisionase family DNA binding protein